MPVPERLRRAVELLDLAPGNDVLEIGSGSGLAAAMVSRRLAELGGPASRVMGIDRSATATARAELLHHDAIGRGRVDFAQVALTDADPTVLGRYDVVFAVNVNVFWARPAQRELLRMQDLLAPEGRAWLFFAPPAGVDIARLRDAGGDALERAGYDFEVGFVEMRAGTLVWFRAVVIGRGIDSSDLPPR